MKDFINKKSSNLGTKPFFSSTENNPINSNYISNYTNNKISSENSFENLEQIKTVELNIINSRISSTESKNNTSFENSDIYSKIKEIAKKYKDYPLININQLPKIILSPQPLFNTQDNFNNIKLNNNNNNTIQSLYPFNVDNNYLLYQLFPNSFKQNLSKNNFPLDNNNINNINNITFLNKKRKSTFFNSQKKLTKYKVLITTTKLKEEESDSDSNTSKNVPYRKVIFRLDKKYKIPSEIKIKKNPGRKKKNSGEIGIHNKFSKDNMMRKLKNKVMESARKLLNKMIKVESGEDFKDFGEMRKIQGLFCQELNIKFNYWFYFQKLKTFFQFKMSSKYSKGDVNSNHILIAKIYSEKNVNKFPKTIKLLDTMFYQYYHDIFLGEKNWTEEYDITPEENIYQINNILFKNKNDLNEEDLKYAEKMQKLARKYELFFLKKNPRIYGIKTDSKISQTKEIIKNISMEDYEKYKYYFVLKSIQHLPEIKNTYEKYLIKNKAIYNTNFESDLLLEINYNSNNINNIMNNVAMNKKGEKEIDIFEKNDEKEIKEKAENDIKNKNIDNVIKPIKFDVKFFEFYKKIKNGDNKEKHEDNKKIKFEINRKEKTNKIKFVNNIKGKNDKERNIIAPKHLFVINKNNIEKSNSLSSLSDV